MLKAIEDANKPRQDNTTVVVVDVSEKAGSAAPLAPAAPAAAMDPEDVTTRTGDTQEMSVDEIEDAVAQHTGEGTSSGGKAIIIAVVAIVLLAVLGAAGYFFMSNNASQDSDDAPASTTSVMTAIISSWTGLAGRTRSLTRDGQTSLCTCQTARLFGLTKRTRATSRSSSYRSFHHQRA